MVDDVKKPKKLKRVPLFKQQNISVNKDPNFHYHIAIDIDDRIQKFITAGYVFADSNEVLNSGPSQNTSVVGKESARISLGGSGHGYLMKLPRKIWEQDQIDQSNERMKNRESSFNNIKNIPSNLQRGSVQINEVCKS